MLSVKQKETAENQQIKDDGFFICTLVRDNAVSFDSSLFICVLLMVMSIFIMSGLWTLDPAPCPKRSPKLERTLVLEVR